MKVQLVESICLPGHRRKLLRLLNKHKGSDLSTEVIEQRTLFRDRLLKFRHLQRVFQPETLVLLTVPPTSSPVVISDDGDDVHLTTLLLPSSLPSETLVKASPKLIEMEKELRLGQCQDALAQLRSHLHSRARVLKDKFVNVRHQGANTRSRGLLDRISAKIDMSAEKYRAAYLALHTLDSNPAAKWRAELQPLRQGDIRTMSGEDMTCASSGPPSSESDPPPTRHLLPGGVLPEGSRTLSWIWSGTLNDASTTPGFNECKCIRGSWVWDFTYHCFLAFRLEWCKARARSERWKEEVLLLKEEMRRTLVFIEVNSEVWEGRASSTTQVVLSNDPAIRDGMSAYAQYQSHVFSSLHHLFRSLWSGLENAETPPTEPTPIMSEDALMELLGGDS